MAQLSGDRVVLGSYLGHACSIVQADFSGGAEACEFPMELVTKYGLVAVPPHLVALAHHSEVLGPVHVLSLSDSQFIIERSFGDLGPGATSADSALLRHGVGLAAAGRKDRFVYTSWNPLHLQSWTIDGRLVSEVRPNRALRDLRTFQEPGRLDGPVTVSGLIDRVTGLHTIGGNSVASSYAPSDDVSTFWMLSPADGDVQRVDLPFQATIVAGNDEFLIVTRAIDRVELVAYRIVRKVRENNDDRG